ncbi:MAG: hypothetical protein ACJ780_27035 [Solirubrobacteraceae bacterium]
MNPQTIWALLLLGPVVVLGLIYVATVVIAVWVANEPEHPEHDHFR